jgi:2-desacetyl-2-hydroxyethyl bacteriochlorophyllide A dehydrogenase
MRISLIAFTGPRRVELVEVDEPIDALGPTEVLVRTKLTLLSGGTEGAWFQSQAIPGRPPMRYPFRTGYANIGEVVSVGSGVSTLAAGDVVYSMGNHASMIKVDAASRVCVRVPSGLPFEQAVFARLLTVPMASVRTASARAGDRAAVTGLGLVGNLGAQLLQACGMPVTAADPIVARRELARKCGIGSVIDPTAPGSLRPEHRLVLECSGTAKGTLTAIALARLGGEVSLVGTPWVADASVSSSDILVAVHTQYITLRSGWEWQLPIPDVRDIAPSVHQPGSIGHNTAWAFELIGGGRVQVADLLTHRFTPTDCQRAYEGAVDRKSEQLGAVFYWA